MQGILPLWTLTLSGPAKYMYLWRTLKTLWRLVQRTERVPPIQKHSLSWIWSTGRDWAWKVSSSSNETSLTGGHFQQNDEETVRVQFCFTSTRDRERPRTATSTFTQFLRFEWTRVRVQCCFTSTETIGTIRDGSGPGWPPGLLLSSWALSSVLLYIHRNHKDCQGRGATQERPPGLFTQFLSSEWTGLEFRFASNVTSTETIRTVRDGERSPGRPPRLRHSSWALGTVNGLS